MEVMSTSLDKFYPKVFRHDLRMEESVLGKVTKKRALFLLGPIDSAVFPDCHERGECPALPARPAQGDPSGCEALQHTDQSGRPGQDL